MVSFKNPEHPETEKLLNNAVEIFLAGVVSEQFKVSQHAYKHKRGHPESLKEHNLQEDFLQYPSKVFWHFFFDLGT